MVVTEPSSAPPAAGPPPAHVVDTVTALPGGTEWLSSLGETVDRLRAQWGLRIGHPFTGGSCSWVAPVALASGESAVLKASYPHREARGEAQALRFWAGDGAVWLHDSTDDDFALLIEACEPGTRLSETDGAPEDLLVAGAHALSVLWKREPDRPSDPRIERVGDVTAEWAALVRERMARLRPDFDAHLVEVGASLLEALPATAERTAVVHGDFNPGNLLASGRGRWLAIDPKPMIGDPAYDLWPLIMQVDPPIEHADPRAVLRRRFALAADILGEPADRLAAWAFARAVESAFDRLNMGVVDAADSEMEEAEALADIAGL